jgi:ribose transport system substrate-binding protein
MRKTTIAALAAAGLLALSACQAAPATTTEPPATEPAATEPAATESTEPAAAETPLAIAFFGFAKANSFANASWAGVEKYAAENNATAEFFDGAFNAEQQVQQIQDATTSGKYQVYVIQANDGASVITAVEAAVAAGIQVVAEFTPIGTEYDTAEPQVEGIYSLVDVPSSNGTVLGEMGSDACKLLGADPCKVAYLQGNAQLPLDNARTEAVVTALKAAGAEVIDNFQGGYTPDDGRAATQDLLQSHPDVNVIIGSSQAIAGAEQLVDTEKVKLIGNGGSTQAVTAVQEGRWYGVYFLNEVQDGYEAAKTGAEAARGGSPAKSVNLATLDFNYGAKGTAETLKGVVGSYDD